MTRGIRNIDLFAVPVSLTYKGRKNFNTLAGGCFSVLLMLFFVSYGTWTLVNAITSPQLRSQTESFYMPRTESKDILNMTTIESTIAVNVQQIKIDQVGGALNYSD